MQLTSKKKRKHINTHCGYHVNHPAHNSIILKQYGSTHTQETGFSSFHAMWNYNCMKLASWKKFLLCAWHPWSNYSWNSSSQWAMPQHWRMNTELVISAASNYMSRHNSIRCLLLKYILKNNLTVKRLCHTTVYITLQHWKHSCVTKEKNYIRGQATGNGRGKIKGNGGYLPRSWQKKYRKWNKPMKY